MAKVRKKKSSKNLVPVGTHVPMTTKLAIQAMAESQNKSVYEFLQETLTEMVEEFEAELEALKGKEDSTPGSEAESNNGEDLLA